MKEQLQLLMLKAGGILADQEMNAAQANHDLQRYGEWRCDYHGAHLSMQDEFEKVIRQAETIINQSKGATA